MKYFFDTEFIEGFKDPLFGKKRHFIDLISIGILAEDGRKYYAVSKEFSAMDADEWVMENVIGKLYNKNGTKREPKAWKSNKQIAQEIIDFVYAPLKDTKRYGVGLPLGELHEKDKIAFYSYYADYDWVLLCSLFGRMIDLPKHFPMYCRDIKQMLDERGLDKEWQKKHVPKPEGNHHALVDAKYHMDLYNAVKSIKS